MTTFSPDRRQITAKRTPEARARLEANWSPWLDLEIQIAKDLAEMDENAAFVFEGSTSIGELGARLGYGAPLAFDLCWLGRAMGADPMLEGRLREGKEILSRAVITARVRAQPDLVRPGDDWAAATATLSETKLKRMVRARLEEARQRARGVVEVTVLVAQQTKDDFDRCRDVASKQEGKELSDSQTFGRVVNHYLDAEDPLRQAEGTRRVGPTEERPYDRYVPAEVARRVVARSGGMCEVRGCQHVAKDMAHVRPHADGSGREEKDLWYACDRHHVLYDAGVIVFAGWTSEGKPRFAVAVTGEELTAGRFPSPSPSDGVARTQHPNVRDGDAKPPCDRVCESATYGVPQTSVPGPRGLAGNTGPPRSRAPPGRDRPRISTCHAHSLTDDPADG